MKRKTEVGIGQVQLAVPTSRPGAPTASATDEYRKRGMCRNEFKLRERSMTNRGFLSGLITACNGWIPRSGRSPGGSRTTARIAMYSAIRSRTAAVLCALTVFVLPNTSGGGCISSGSETPSSMKPRTDSQQSDVGPRLGSIASSSRIHRAR